MEQKRKSADVELTEKKKFHNNTCDLIRVIMLIANGPASKYINKLLVNVASTYIRELDHKVLIEGFILRSYQFWDSIKKHDEKFFLENADKVFGELPSSEVNMFKGVFGKKEDGSEILSKKYKNCLWSYFEANVRISLKYLSKLPEKSELFGLIGEDFSLETEMNKWEIK